MEYSVKIVLGLLLLIWDPVVGSIQQKYVILAPNYVKENTDILVSVSNAGRGSSAQFEVTLAGNGMNNEMKTLSVAERDSAMVRLTPPFLSRSAQYKLRIRDIEITNEVHEIPLTVIQKTVAILIQTDKPIYKPGDTIKFRVLALDRRARPLTTLRSVKIQLRDSQQSLIREWPYAKLQNGVFQSQLELANFVDLGNWAITVEALNNEVKHKTITVAEYVLPKHEIRITYPKFATFKDKTMQLIVDARYTFGKPIQGSLSVSVVNTNVQNNTSINGRAHIYINLQNVLPSASKDEVFLIQVKATIEESGSGQLYESTESIPIYKISHKISLRKSSEYLLPETPFKCWIVLTDPTGQPLENSGKVKVTVNRQIKHRSDESFSLEQTPNKDGVLPLTFDTSLKLNLSVTYDGETTNFLIDSIDNIPVDRSFITVSVLTESLLLNKPIDVQVQSSFAMTFLMYHIVAQGMIVASGNVHVESKQSVVLPIQPTSEMIPLAHVIVFAVHNEQLFSDIVEFKMQNLDNYVNLTLSRTETEPGTKLSIGVRSQPGSMIGLLGIDKSILLLGGNGNDIIKKALFDELQGFGPVVEDQDDEIKRLGFSVITNARKPEVDDTHEFIVDPRFGAGQSSPVIRKNFPETWLWTDMAPVNYDGALTIDDTVPDSITSWSISAFSINNEYGLGIIDQPVSLNVLKPFFITVNVAYSIMKTEIALVEVFIFNYMNEAQEATIKLVNDRGEFQFANERKQITAEWQQLRTVSVPVASVSKVTFLLKPLKTGNLVITVMAETATRKDAVEQILRVTPGGLRYYRNTARFIDVESPTQSFERITLDIPSAATAGTENITFSVEGLLLGAALQNLGKLIRLPAGCGEQNMLNLVPSVLALEYMRNADTLDYSTEQKALNVLRRGYQNQLRFKLSDGSFNVFRKRRDGSVFLTAFVANIFRLAGKHITVDENVIRRAYDWVRNKQDYDGSFSEMGQIFHRGIQGGLRGGVTLTAFTLISFLEHKNIAHQYRSVIDRGTDFLSRRIYQLYGSYELSMVVYALQLAKHPQMQLALDKLLQLSRRDAKLSMRWWETGSTSIETTGYALLTYVSMGKFDDAEPIMKWLVTQRYDKGGYDNTQNTYVGLHALAEYSRKLSSSRNNYQITVSTGSGWPKTVYVYGSSSLKTQYLPLPNDARYVDVTITGTGTGVYQIAYQYNLIAADDEPRFEIINTMNRNRGSTMGMHICSRFKPKSTHEITNMVIMEVLFPSGYVVSDETLTRLNRAADVRRVETKRDGTMLILYFDPFLPDKSVCVDVLGWQKATVLGQIAGWVKVYDYYDPTREAIKYFDGPYA